MKTSSTSRAFRVRVVLLIRSRHSLAFGPPPVAVAPTTAFDTRAGAPGDGGGLSDGGEVSLALRSVLAAERANEHQARANDIGVQQLRMQHEAGQRALKTEKDASDKHDTHDMKILRMLVNGCSASYTPPVAESDSPTAETSMLTSSGSRRFGGESPTQ